MRTLLIALLAACLTGCGGSSESPSNRPEVQSTGIALSLPLEPSLLWSQRCVQCHGESALHSADIPALDTLFADYISRQLRHFRDGVRTNAIMLDAVADLSDAQIAALSTWLTQQPAPSRPDAPSAPARGIGQDYYNNTCSACHGTLAQGNEALSAPALRGLGATYLAGQYQAFLNGKRGSDPRDLRGAQMQRLARALPDNLPLAEIFAYIDALPVSGP
jgi:cytochrome c553